ncbi:MAG TPA: c-type cytochrome [Oxalicibacterium sp.]|nr:c-type cytochrome [Oxalicibacterium sp.]
MQARQTVPHRSHCALALALVICGTPASAGDIARGQRLLAQYQCGACHAIPRVDDARGRAGPPLEKFGRRAYIAGHVPNNADNLARWIADPRALVPDTAMPNMGVSPDDARAMAAYLLTLQ